MKAILEFDLTDIDDEVSHKQCVKARDMAIVLWEFGHNSRKKIEWALDADEEIDKYGAMDLVFERFFELLNERNISTDELCP